VKTEIGSTGTKSRMTYAADYKNFNSWESQKRQFVSPIEKKKALTKNTTYFPSS
jgi:hypothetical protein